MSKQQELIDKLSAEFQPHFLIVENESHMHRSDRGINSHFKIVIASNKFEGISKVARHRQIYQLLEKDLQIDIHALALHTYTEEEWLQAGKNVPPSVSCQGLGA